MPFYKRNRTEYSKCIIYFQKESLKLSRTYKSQLPNYVDNCNQYGKCDYAVMILILIIEFFIFVDILLDNIVLLLIFRGQGKHLNH